MASLVFNRTTRPKGRRVALLAPASALVVPCSRLMLTGHLVAAAYLAGGMVLLFGVLWLVYRSSWTGIGPEGITRAPGHRRPRTLPWSEISWIGVRTVASNRGVVRSVRVTTTTGKRFLLPCVTDSLPCPDPDFDHKVEQITACWKAHTDRSSRIEPEPSRGDARYDALIRFNRSPLGASRRLVRTGWCQAALALLFAGLAVHALSAVPGDRSTAAAYRHRTVCPTAPDPSTLTLAQLRALTADPSPADCVNHEPMTVDSTVIGSNPLAESRLYLSAVPDNGTTYEVDFGTATPWLRSLQPDDPIYADYVANGQITDVGSGNVMLHDTESPAYLQNTAIADAVAFGSVALLMGAWSAALLRRRYNRALAPGGFRWWVTCSLPAVVITVLVDNHLQQDPAPLVADYVTVPAVALAAGLVLALGLSRIRPRRGGTAGPGSPTEWHLGDGGQRW
ncbi:hypothetical protein [Streptacidiphilus sp. P02-A3a]|uniref:hypothetical protein n=1 Tax=Streptacidiphilus sp. P02-A3a TaxID=2704468 RepID=UPI0015F9A6F2|nr:hypothetical protein [Streptacidiphilus sp. P02-A3a]QMU68657.1 hypothetical protein GXP74_10845 [Streptacidiphilus sp. P02-A3a]